MSGKPKIIIADFIADALKIEKHILGDYADIVALNAVNETELVGKIEDADAIILYHCISLGKDSIRRLKNCKLILRAGVGIDNVDLAFARSRGIPVANIPDYGSEDVADTAIGMMLALTRGISLLNSRLQNNIGDWSYLQAKPLSRLRNKILGIIGLGRIGTATALRAKSFGMNVIFYDPYKPDGFDKALGIGRFYNLSELLAKVEILTLHCPLTRETHHLINSESLKNLPMGSYLINTSRGNVVDTSAIPSAIETGRLSGAAFDVLGQEPPLDDVLVDAWRNPLHPAFHKVLINPHSAFYSEEGLEEIRVKGIQACIRAIQGTEIRNVVN
jgi:C-terminal binding protein